MGNTGDRVSAKIRTPGTIPSKCSAEARSIAPKVDAAVVKRSVQTALVRSATQLHAGVESN